MDEKEKMKAWLKKIRALPPEEKKKKKDLKEALDHLAEETLILNKSPSKIPFSSEDLE